jgi:uncharacterized protein with PQ loop repeat
MKDYLLTHIVFVIAVVATIPQLYQSLKTGRTVDFSASSLALNVLGNLLLAIHGFTVGDRGLFLIGTWFTIYTGILLGLKQQIF